MLKECGIFSVSKLERYILLNDKKERMKENVQQELKMLKSMCRPARLALMREADGKPRLPRKECPRKSSGTNTILKAVIPKQQAQGKEGEAWKARQS